MTSLAERAAQLSPNARAALARELVRAGTTFPTDICEPVAVVGIGCRFPGNVTGPESFWQLLADGVDTIEQVPPDRWDADAFYDPDPSASGRMTTKWGGFVSDVDAFDADFFGITPREAVAMDPQHRMLLEVAWEALEHAGIPPDSLSGTRTGVMMGLSSWDYTIVNIERRADIDAYLSTGTPHCAAVGRIAYLLGLRGPAVAVDTACSSSLVAIHLACQSLRLRETDVALAGGVQLTLSPFTAIALSKWSALSPTGRCNSFDANADGFVRGEGCGVVVLKRLADAVRDQDRVLAVVRGSATNSDGRSNGMTAPNALAQRDVITSALKLADVTPDSVNYVETHGTGTVLGDPIEFESLAATYGLGKGQGESPCALGSVKTNIGHLEGAIGRGGWFIGTGGMATIGGGGNGQSIVIDFVRHGQTPGNAAMLIDTAVPGPGLTALGQQQAQAIANALAAKGPYAGIFDSQLIRTQQTAAPLANLLGMAPQVLPGLNEIHAGIFEDLPQISPAGLLYLVGPIAWTLGFPIVPMLAPGSTDVNGIVFNRAFTGAVQTIYDASLANPVVAADGNITSVAYSSAFTIGVGTMMNVDNPHPLLLLTHPVPNTGAVVVQGNPEGGWTLVSWDGIPVGPASLPTALFVDVRELITAPQYAAYDIWESLFTGDPAAVINAVRDGADEVGAAVVQFPHAVADDVIDATGHPYLSGLPIGLPSLIP